MHAAEAAAAAVLRGPRGGRPAPEGARLLLGPAGAGASAMLRTARILLPATTDARPRPAKASVGSHKSGSHRTLTEQLSQNLEQLWRGSNKA